MRNHSLCLLGSCVIALLYPVGALVFRDAVVLYVFFGPLFLGLYRYFVGLGGFVRREVPDALAFLFRGCRGRISLRAIGLALVSAVLLAVFSLLPVRILLDFSMPLAKVALFIPLVYCVLSVFILLKKNSKKR